MDDDVEECTDAVTGQKIFLSRKDVLTVCNVVSKLKKYLESLKDKKFDGEIAMTLSFYMDYAISTKDIDIIYNVHDEITCYFLTL